MECHFCNKILNSQSSLNVHQKSTKYCLKIQGKLETGTFVCECGDSFTLKSSLHKHTLVCNTSTPYVQDLRKEILDKDKTILLLQQQVLTLEKDKLDLQERYAALAKVSASRVTTKNTVNNNLNLSVFTKTDKDIKRIVDENYTKEYLLEGQKGVAKFTCSHIIKGEDDKPPIYVITDKARGNGKYKVSETEVVTDTGLVGLTKKLHPSIKQRAIIIATEGDAFTDEELFKGYQEVFNMGDDNSIFKTELVRILEPVCSKTV